MKEKIKIESLDHLVLTVADIVRTCSFYTQVLEMQEVTFGGGRKALQFGKYKINLHEYGREVEPKAQCPMPGSADLCFITRLPWRLWPIIFRHAELISWKGPCKGLEREGR